MRRERDGGFDVAGLRFEHPVATQRSGAGFVGRGGNIGLGEAGEFLNEAGASRALRDVAAVEQKVAVLGQRLADGGECGAVAGERVGTEPRRAKRGLPRRTVTEEVNGGNVALAGQGIGHNLQTVFAGAYLIHRGTRCNAVDQGLHIGQTCVDKHGCARRIARRLGGHRGWLGRKKGDQVAVGHIGQRLRRLGYRRAIKQNTRLQRCYQRRTNPLLGWAFPTQGVVSGI